MDTSEEPDLSPDVLEAQVATAMERARTRAGLTVEAMVRRLRPALRMPPGPPGRGVRQNWYDWRQNPRSLPAVALLAAAKLAGLPVDSLLSDSADRLEAQATRLASLENQVAELTRRLERRERQEHPPSASKSVGPDTAAVEGNLAVLERRLYEVGRQLGRQWDEPGDRDDSTSLAEFLRQRIGTFEARLSVLAGMVGAQSGGYPSAPDSLDVDDLAFQAWFADVIGILQSQVPTVLERAEALAGRPESRRQASDRA